MFFKFWIISTLVCLVLFASVVASICISMKKEFTKEEIEKYRKKKSDNKYAWYVYIFTFVCPILNILFTLLIGFIYGQIKEDIFKNVRKANGKMTFADRISEEINKVSNNYESEG